MPIMSYSWPERVVSGISLWRKCDQHFTWHLKNNQSRLEIYFGTRLDERSRAAHMISNNRSGSCWPDPGVHLYFRPSKKNQMSAICAYESNLKFFFNFAISRGTWKINQARIWTGEYFIGQTSAVLTLSHQTAR